MRPSFDRVADLYDETRSYTPEGMRRTVEELQRMLEPDGRVLEVGVGTGRIALPLQERGYDVTGLDLSEGMLARARVKGLRQMLRGDVRAMPFADRTFRHALSVHVTHLLPEWSVALSEICRVASDMLVSVVLEKTGSEAERMQTVYEEACAGLGFEVRHPGLRESDLGALVEPRTRAEVSDELTRLKCSEAVERYRQRMYSDQWGVPEEVHRQAVDRVQAEFEGVDEVERREVITVLSWDLDDVRRFVADM